MNKTRGEKIALRHQGGYHKKEKQNFNSKLGDLLKYFREKNDFALERVANNMKVDITRQAIFEYEKGKSGIKLDKLYNMMKILKINPEYLELLEYSHLLEKIEEHNISAKQLEILLELIDKEIPITKFREEYIEKVNKYNENREYYIEENKREVNARSKHTNFAKKVKENYSHKCSICGINTKGLLVCSHIIPWVKDRAKKVDKDNAICLCVLHDKLFDKGYITIKDDYSIKLSPIVKRDKILYSKIKEIEGEKIELPKEESPNKENLKYHRENIFKEIDLNS